MDSNSNSRQDRDRADLYRVGDALVDVLMTHRARRGVAVVGVILVLSKGDQVATPIALRTEDTSDALTVLQDMTATVAHAAERIAGSGL